MLVVLCLTLLLGFSQCENFEDNVEGADELLPGINPKMDLKVELDPEREDSPWWMVEEEEEEAKEKEEELERKHEDENEEEDQNDESDSSQRQGNGNCPKRGTKCHALGGSCDPTGSKTEHCESVSKDPKICKDRRCHCCIDCDKSLARSLCKAVKGRCREKNKCNPYQYSDVFNPCRALTACTCCRYCITSKNCRIGGGNPGLCVGDTTLFMRYSAVYRYKIAKCKEPLCSCVKVCVREPNCRKAGGYCVRNGLGCKPNYLKFQCGCRDNANCACCVPSQNRDLANFECSPLGLNQSHITRPPGGSTPRSRT